MVDNELIVSVVNNLTPHYLSPVSFQITKGQVRQEVAQQNTQMHVHVCVCNWLTGKPGMFADAHCVEEQPCNDEVSHYPKGWRCQLKWVHLDKHFIGIYLKSVFGFELAVWVQTQFFLFFSFFVADWDPVFSNIPLVFLGKTCTMHSSSFPHQPATNNLIALQCLLVTSCV